jgi:hypothetical protein
MGGLNNSDLGLFHIESNGTLVSLDSNEAVLDSKQLTGEEFMGLTGCNMTTPDMPSPVGTEQCLQNRTTIGNSGISVKRDGEVFERALSCGAFLCTSNRDCTNLASARCLGCVRVGLVRFGACISI